MTTVFTRQTTATGANNQNAPLTNAQLDANFINLNNDKIGNEATGLPAIRPTLLLDFGNSQHVDSRITFTRASTATRVNARGLIESVASGVPRIDFDPVTGACKGLLLEPAATNLLTYSEQFDDAAWSKAQVFVIADAVVAPNGAMTGDMLVEAAATNQHIVTSTVATNGEVVTVSIYAKKAGRTGLHIRNGNIGVSSIFNLDSGVVTSQGSGQTATIIPMGGGWYKCSVSYTSVVGAQQVIFGLASGASISYLGDGTSGIYIWGAQLEAGSTPTSYIPTEASAVTRAADVAVMTGTNFSSWYRQDEGSFVTEYILSNITTNCGVMAVSDGTNSNRMIVRGASDANPRFIWVASGALSVLSDFAVGLANTRTLVAFGYKTNDFAGTRNGVEPVTNVSCVVPTVSMLRLGADGDGVFPLNGHIRSLAYYPKRAPNSELQALSTP